MNLVNTKRNLQKYFSVTNADSADRKAIIDTIEQLVNRFILPAMEVGSLAQDSINTFDLDAVAETEIHGLMVGLFETKLDGLNEPADDKLKEAILAIGLRDLKSEQMKNFYTVWAGEKAVESVSYLTNLLETGTFSTKDSVHFEKNNEKIGRLLKLNLPESVASRLKTIVVGSEHS